MIIVARHVEGCFLNDLEYLLDDSEEVMEFETEEEAMDYLREHGMSEEDMEYIIFLDKEKAD